MTVKHIDTYSKKWPVAIIGSISSCYLLFGLPFHAPIAIYALFNANKLMSSHFLQDRLLATFFILTFALASLIIINSIYKQRRNVKVFTSHFKEKEMNAPLPSNIARSWTGLSYLGLDTKTGTLLYINHPDTTIFNFLFPRDVRVMGFGMYDYKSIELEGNTLRIYTGDPELPYVAIASGKAAQMYEKINAMRGKPWKYENNIPGYVEHNAIRIAEKHGLNLILPPA